MSSPLRIAHLSATFPPYQAGMGNVCFHFAVEQARRGHHVEVFTAAHESAQEVDSSISEGLVIHRDKPLFAIGNAPLIPRMARIGEFDVVHLHYPFIFGMELFLASRLVRRDSALVVSYHLHLVGNRARRPLFWAYEQLGPRILMRHADRICVLSRGHAESVGYLRAMGERRPEKLVEMPNGVDVEAFSPAPDGTEIRSELGIPHDDTLAVFVATLDRAHHFKRLDLAIRAIAAVPDVHLAVAGEGELLDSYRELARELGVSDRVHFRGAVGHERLPDLLRAGDFLLFTTQPPESFGIVLIEAMACGLPVVATEYPGVRAVVDPDENGFLAPVGDLDRIIAAVRLMVARGPEGRAAMGAAGRAKCERTWSWPRLAERMDRVYADAIAAHGGEAR